MTWGAGKKRCKKFVITKLVRQFCFDRKLSSLPAINKIVEYIEMPLKLKKQYQNYTRADISKLRGTGYMKEFTKVEHAVSDYILNYLV